MNYAFQITGPIEVFESVGINRLRLEGTFIRLNVATKNGRVYKVQEAQEIASNLVGKSVYFGVDKKGIHINRDDHLVGKVVKTFINKAKNIISGVVEVWNTFKFPDLISKIKKGWGFSIGGVVEKFLHTGIFNDRMMPILECVGMRANHIQLLEPHEKRGDPTANVKVVKLIPVMESMLITPDPFKGKKEILEIIIIEDDR